MKKKTINNKIAVYQAKTGAIMLKSDLARETIWATQSQIAEIFEIERSVVTKHVNNILKSREIDPISNVQKMHIANRKKVTKQGILLPFPKTRSTKHLRRRGNNDK